MDGGQQTTRAILRRHEVEQRTGLSCSTIYKRMRAGRFPQAVSLGGRMVGWRAEDIEAFLANPSRYRTRVDAGVCGEREQIDGDG